MLEMPDAKEEKQLLPFSFSRRWRRQMRRIFVYDAVAVVVQTVEMLVCARINFGIVVVAVARLFGSENAERFA